ncbi:MAG TPA: AMP-binding protein, partial [Lysobacter sp.]|nr:AMP-binding protein [Lysobacter sp.]
MPVFETLRQLVERNEKLFPDETCLIYEERRLTFREFAERTRRLASALHGLGMRHQDRVAMLAMNCPEYLDVYGVGEVAGFIVAPINFRLAPPETAYIIRDASPRVLIFESQYAEVIETLRDQLPSVQHYICIGDTTPAWALAYETVLASGSPEGPPLRPTADDILMILYTSGTTGRPKGVMTTHEQNIWLAEMQAFENSSDLGDKFLLMMPFYHLGGRSQSLGHYFRAGTVIMQRKFDPLDVVRTIERERVTQVHLAPTMLQEVLDLPDIDRYDLSSLKSLQHAAAPMSVTLLKRAVKKFGPILIDGFGQTEGGGTTLRRHHHKVDEDVRNVKRLASVGQPQLHTQMKIVDDNDNEVPVGSIGEICFKS